MSGARRKTTLQRLAPVLGVGLFLLALWVLRRELGRYHYRDLLTQLDRLPLAALVLALALTAGSYLVLTCYDALSLRYVERPLPWRRSALAAFLGYAFSHNMGFAIFSGAPLRYRLYSVWGLSGLEVTTLVAFNGLTFWLGLFTVAGFALMMGGGVVPASASLGFDPQLLAPVFLVVVAGYLVLCLRGKRTVHIGRWRLELPGPRLALAQLVISSIDWSVAASVLWVLLPRGQVSYPHLLAVFVLAQVSGVLSQVPGGLGVFESVVMLLLDPVLGEGTTLAVLLAYRAIYYLIPLAVAILLLLAYEIRERRAEMRQLSRMLGSWLPTVAPPLLAVTTLLGGAILLVSGATPALHTRLAWLNDVLPLPVVEASHFLGSVAGVGLALLAWGIHRRLESAYYLTVTLLGAGVVFSLLKGFDYEEAIALAVMLLVLLPARRFFYRRASLLAEPLSPGWLAALAMVVAGSLWLGFFVHRHVVYSGDLWWSFALQSDAPRFLRAMVGIAVTILAFGVARLLGPPATRVHPPTAEELTQARAVIGSMSATWANLALLGDKSLLLSDTGRSFLMYAVEGRSWVAMGGAVGPPEEHTELIWRFHGLADRHGGWTVFYEAGPQDLPLFTDLGLAVFKIGEEATVPLTGFTLEGRARKGLRYVVRKLETEGCVFEVVGPGAVPALIPELAEISDAWLERKHTREKSFSLGRFDPGYLANFPLALVRQEGRVVAFANVWQAAAGTEISIDLMRHLPTAPNGVMDYLFARLMLWGGEHGWSHFNLGMVPLAGLRVGPLAPVWNRLAGLVYRHGTQLYNFQGLRQYKQKFEPVWEPRYLACPGGRAVPGVVSDLIGLVSGGLRGVVRR